VTLAIEVGLDRTPNGQLIKEAEDLGFDGLVTPDANLRYQQNLVHRRLAIIVLPSGRWPAVREQLDDVVAAIDDAVPGSYREIPFRKPSR
jgi:hypothetical protein